VKVENDRNAGAQQTNDMRRERRAQPFATLEEIGERFELRPIKLLDPAILADDPRLFRLAKLAESVDLPALSCRTTYAASHSKRTFERSLEAGASSPG
jgi:hypothetical protein